MWAATCLPGESVPSSSSRMPLVRVRLEFSDKVFSVKKSIQSKLEPYNIGLLLRSVSPGHYLAPHYILISLFPIKLKILRTQRIYQYVKKARLLGINFYQLKFSESLTSKFVSIFRFQFWFGLPQICFGIKYLTTSINGLGPLKPLRTIESNCKMFLGTN